MDRRDVGFISNNLALLDTTRFEATRMTGSWNVAAKRAWVRVVPKWVTPWEVLTRSPETVENGCAGKRLPNNCLMFGKTKLNMKWL